VSGADDPFVELRADVLREHIDVIDAVVQATPGASRSSVVREILREWVEHEKHRAMLVLRVSRGNGNEPAPERTRTGTGPASGRKP
jgi:Arc/MetJ-type ribon-helix-helix transcriptional regulator